MSPIFAACNRNKRGAAIDLQHPEGQRVAFELARRADVIIENFVPGVAAKLGLGYDAVRAVNPTVVYASVSGFGQTGPYARRPGYNTIAMGMSGVMALTGWPDDPPTRPGGSIADLAASFLTFGGINAALVHRFRFGEGQCLDVDLLSAMMGMLPDPVADYFDSGNRPPRVGNRNPFLTPAEAFKTQDGYLNVVLTGPDQYGPCAPRSGRARGLPGDGPGRRGAAGGEGRVARARCRVPRRGHRPRAGHRRQRPPGAGPCESPRRCARSARRGVQGIVPAGRAGGPGGATPDVRRDDSGRRESPRGGAAASHPGGTRDGQIAAP
jgi:hypothetical protein